jgi:uncharacterized membrane protein YdjX (TVP38/TMEM64 family)
MIVPVTALIAVTVLAFGPILGFFYALIGMTASALLSFWMGHLLGRQSIRRLAGSRLSHLSRRLAQKGVLAVILIRIIPVAPFTIVNLVAGASHIRFRDFALGTVLGEVPGLLVLALFVDQVSETVRHPSMMSVSLLVGVVLFLFLSGVSLWRRLNGPAKPEGPLPARARYPCV